MSGLLMSRIRVKFNVLSYKSHTTTITFVGNRKLFGRLEYLLYCRFQQLYELLVFFIFEQQGQIEIYPVMITHQLSAFHDNVACRNIEWTNIVCYI